MPRHEFTLFADYHQFHLRDEAAQGNLATAWTDEASDRMLAVAPGVVGVGTARNMDVRVTVEVLDSAPLPDLAGLDQVVDCSLAADSGHIVVAGCTDHLPDAPRIAVAPGTYRVRVGYAGLDSLSCDGLEGDDSYHVQLWPATASGVVVLKRRPAPPRQE